MLYLGTFAFAIVGALKARTHKMDIFGASVLAFVTAYGGGTIRDWILGVKPVSWMNDYLGLGLVFLAIFIVFLLKQNIARFEKTIFISDALGLGFFTIGGILIGLSYGTNAVYAIMMGVLSATFGGLLADVASQQVPDLLKKGELYATACIIGGMFFLVLKKLGVSLDVAAIASIIVIVTTRVLSRRKNIILPIMQ